MEQTRGIEGIVEKSARAADVHRRAARASSTGDAPQVTEGPWVTVSRQYGSRGSDLAAALGVRLGWEVFDREIVARVAREAHAPEASIERLDEHPMSPLDPYFDYLMVPGDLGQAGYLHEVLHVVKDIARRGRAVIIGRGAHLFLAPQYGLRLRVIAPDGQRIENVAQALHLSERKALHRMREIDGERAAFARQAFGADLDDPMHYDLTVNLGAMPLEAAADIVITALTAKLGRQALGK